MVDGVPGRPAGVRELAQHWLGHGQAAAEASGRLRAVDVGALRLQGDFAPKVAAAVGDLSGALENLARGYRGCGAALNRFADRLEQAQVKARTAESDRDTAVRNRRNAEWDLDQLAPGWDRHADNPTGLRAYLAGRPEPAFTAVSRREQATRDVSLADQLSRQAAALRGDAERDCVRDINRALDDSGLKNRSWWQKTGDWLKTTFTTWAGFVKLCESVSLVLGVVALFLSGPFALILLAATAVVVADRALKLIRGEMSWQEASFDLGMLAVSRFGGRALAPAFRRLGNTRTITALTRATRRGADRLKLGDTGRNLARRAICTVTGHPVDVATGKVFTESTDLELPGPLPFRFDRVWYSTSAYEGPLGHGWHHSYDAALYVTPSDLVWRTPDGRVVELLPLYPGTQWFDRRERITLARDESGVYRVTDSGGLIWRFTPLIGDDENLVVHVPVALTDRAGHRIALGYDEAGRLTSFSDSGGRVLRFELDASGRCTALTAPHPDEPGERFSVARYVYDDLGNLTSVTDALGSVFSYDYSGHLMVRETDRNGLSFHFDYDGPDETARCLRTWGSGGLYDHHLTYAPGVTTVTNSLGHRTTHDVEGGLVIRTVDALGGVHRTEFADQQPVNETDPLGRVTTYAYDARGNLVESSTPDGAVVRVQFDDLDQPVAAVDPVGRSWAWSYDDTGRVTERRDPLGAVTRFDSPDHHDSGLRRFDLLGRVVAVDEPDGNRRTLEYDGEGNLLRAVDGLYDVSFTYSGTGRMTSRTQAGTTVRFEYDTEEQLTGVVNEHGHTYAFTFGPTGEVMTERGFDGRLRLYERDIAGRVVTLRRPSGLMTRYGYDGADRVISAMHSDGSGETFTYRADGALLSAQNADCLVRFERDLVGRVTREYQDDEWVASEYDALGHRTRVTSSLGADVIFVRDARGSVTGMSAGSWSARFERDARGQELARHLPGGVLARWHRDELGRPVRHEVTGPEGVVHDRTYDWGAGNRLRGVVDALTGPIRYEHDGLGQLVSATHADGRVDLRTPDAVGNLFRTPDRTDRTYGPAGELLATPDTTYTYDAEGNLAQKQSSTGETWTYTWRADGFLAGVVRPDHQQVSFTYDALGRRLTKTFADKTTHWLWDGHAPLHERSDDVGAGTTMLRDPHGLSLLAVQSEGPASTIIDHGLGVVGVTAGAVVQSDLDVWGSSSAPEIVNDRWPGQYEDPETGLHYNRYRYYDPDAGTYLSQDPLRLLGGLRLLSYPSDPLSACDPYGLETLDLNPFTLYFSQRTVSSEVEQYAEDMKAGRWDWSRKGPLRVMPQAGNLVSYDNRRLMAAQLADLPTVPAVIVDPDENQGFSKRTWKQAFARRFRDPKNVDALGNRMPVPCGGLKERPRIV